MPRALEFSTFLPNVTHIIPIFNIIWCIFCELVLKIHLQHLSTLKKVNRMKVFNIFAH